jgi:hypothetical protein
MGPEREDDHSPPPNVEYKKAWSCTSTLPYAFISCTETTLPLLCVCQLDSHSVRRIQKYKLAVCRQTGHTHKTAAPYGHRWCIKVLFNLPNSTTNTVCPFAGHSALRSTLAVNPKQTAGKQMTAIYPDWLTDSSVHDMYKGKTGRPRGKAVLTSLMASSFTICTARVIKCRRNGSTEIVKCTRRRQSYYY